MIMTMSCYNTYQIVPILPSDHQLNNYMKGPYSNSRTSWTMQGKEEEKIIRSTKQKHERVPTNQTHVHGHARQITEEKINHMTKQ